MLLLSVVFGDGQVGKAGEFLGDPLVVRVTDENGAPVRGAEVRWSVTSGGGRLVDAMRQPIHLTRTTYDGETQILLIPTRIGITTVTATVGRGARSVVTFTSESHVLVIDNGFWGVYLGPTESSPVQVPVGGTVEWVNSWSPVRIRSTAVPPGGAPFDTGILPPGAGFEFVPQLSGTWEWRYDYFDESGEDVSGAGRGALHVR